MTTVSDLVWRCKPSNVLLIIGNIQSCTSVPSNAFLVSLVLAIPSVCPCCSTSSGNSVLHPYSGSTSQCCFMLMLDPEAKERRSGRFRHLAWSPMVPVVICSKLSGSNDAILWVHSYLYYWLVGWNLFYFSICIGKNIPNWLIMTSIFQSGWNHQPDIILYLKLSIFLELPVDHDSVLKHIVQPMVTMRDPPFWESPRGHMLHGAGIFTYMTGHDWAIWAIWAIKMR